MNQEQIKSYLTHDIDGPVDRFVLISRACELCSINPGLHEEISNVLHDVLNEFDSVNS